MIFINTLTQSCIPSIPRISLTSDPIASLSNYQDEREYCLSCAIAARKTLNTILLWGWSRHKCAITDWGWMQKAPSFCFQLRFVNFLSETNNWIWVDWNKICIGNDFFNFPFWISLMDNGKSCAGSNLCKINVICSHIGSAVRKMLISRIQFGIQWISSFWN